MKLNCGNMSKKYTCACSPDGSYCDEDGWSKPTYVSRGAPATVPANPYMDLAEALYRAPESDARRFFERIDAPSASPSCAAPDHARAIEGIYGYMPAVQGVMKG